MRLSPLHGDLAEEIARFKEHCKSDRLIYIDPYLDGIGGRMPTVLHHGYETSGWIVHAAKSLVGCWSALT